jgi:hypothetical protein
LCCGREPMTCQRAGDWSSTGLPRDLPFEGFDYARSAVTLAPAAFFLGPAACQSRIVRS